MAMAMALSALKSATVWTAQVRRAALTVPQHAELGADFAAGGFLFAAVADDEKWPSLVSPSDTSRAGRVSHRVSSMSPRSASSSSAPERGWVTSG
ncbi:hypothetical protein [Actinoplanes sp. NPDC051411]|uniref:hypothetical protein n=1 Tax=Actinoplanes sp. NPDC051411 TaxID=3155522 RepID=UPI00342967AB